MRLFAYKDRVGINKLINPTRCDVSGKYGIDVRSNEVVLKASKREEDNCKAIPENKSYFVISESDSEYSETLDEDIFDGESKWSGWSLLISISQEKERWKGH